MSTLEIAKYCFIIATILIIFIGGSILLYFDHKRKKQVAIRKEVKREKQRLRNRAKRRRK